MIGLDKKIAEIHLSFVPLSKLIPKTFCLNFLSLIIIIISRVPKVGKDAYVEFKLLALHNDKFDLKC